VSTSKKTDGHLFRFFCTSLQRFASLENLHLIYFCITKKTLIMELRSKFSHFFLLKKHRQNSKGESPIYLRIKINGKAADISVQKSVRFEDWDNTNGVVKGRSSEVKATNKHLFAIKATIYEHYKSLRADGSNVTARQVRNSYLGVKEDNRKKIIEIYKEHNDDIEKLKGIDYSPITVRRYKTSLERLQAYIKSQYKRNDFYIEDINHTFVTRYESFIKTEHKVSHNTAIKFLKHLKKILRIAQANGWMNTDPFVNIKLIEKKTDRGFLTDEDLKKIMELEFEVNRLEEVRDCFIFSCFTGLAHSDLAKLSKDDIVTGTDGNKWIKIHRTKTNTLSRIPVLSVTRRIIEKYECHPYCKTKGVIVPVKSNQKMNAYLKEIKNLAKINMELTTHLARHTFATTVTLNNDVPIESVSKMLGHSSLATTKIYARLLDNKVGKDMLKLNAIY
jgi:site-specific recombinase XerD